MEHRRLVIIHGWSDHAGSFERLADHLGDALGREVETIDLADWVSLDDNVTYEDLVDGLESAWKSAGLAKAGRQTDVVVHSTGSLVVRGWLVKHGGSASSPPIMHFLQLAPANFGSPLAHHGRSVIARAKLGFQVLTGDKKNDLRRIFDPGERLLRGLELASTHTWELAQRDRFGKDASRFGKGRILSTVLVGNEGNVLFAEFDGSDGVVRTSTANMNCASARIDFVAKPKSPSRKSIALKVKESTGRCAFRVINGFRHGDVVLNHARLSKKKRGESTRRVGEQLKDIGVSQQDLLAFMTEALTVTDSGFGAWCNACDDATTKLTEALNTKSDDEVHGHMNIVVRVRNQYDQPVEDFFFEFYEATEFEDDTGAYEGDRSRSVTRAIQRKAIDDVHTFSLDSSCRCFHIDCAAFFEHIAPKLERGLSMSVTARPVLSTSVNNANVVGYYSLNDADIGSVFIPRGELERVFVPHRTLLLDVRMERCQTDDIVRIAPADGRP